MIPGGIDDIETFGVYAKRSVDGVLEVSADVSVKTYRAIDESLMLPDPTKIPHIRTVKPHWHSTVFFLLVLVITSWHLDSGPNDNTMSRAAMVAAIVEDGSLRIDRYHADIGDKAVVDGHYYSDKAPLPAWIVVPIAWLAVQLGVLPSAPGELLGPALLCIGGFICGSIPLALLITLAWKDLKTRSATAGSANILPANAVLLAALPLLGSFCFVYSGSFYNHLPEALFAVLAAQSISKEDHLRAGVWSGAAVLCGSAMMLLVVVWIMQVVLAGKWRGLVHLGIGLLPAILASAAHNHGITGHPFVFPNAYSANYAIMHQQYGFGTWQPKAFFGMLLSDYRGLLFYMPFLVIGLWVVPKGTRWKELLRDPYVLPALLLIAAFLTHATWWGGWTYGPRYIMAAAVLLNFSILHRIGNGRLERWSFWISCCFGLVCAIAAISTVSYSLPTEVLHPFTTEIIPRLLRGEFTTMQIPVLLGVSPIMSTFAFIVVLIAMLILLVRVDRHTKTA